MKVKISEIYVFGGRKVEVEGIYISMSPYSVS